MADHPLTVLVIFTVSYWICMSWMFTQCERYNNNYTTEHCYMNSLWFIIVYLTLSSIYFFYFYVLGHVHVDWYNFKLVLLFVVTII